MTDNNNAACFRDALEVAKSQRKIFTPEEIDRYITEHREASCLVGGIAGAALVGIPALIATGGTLGYPATAVATAVGAAVGCVVGATLSDFTVYKPEDFEEHNSIYNVKGTIKRALDQYKICANTDDIPAGLPAFIANTANEKAIYPVPPVFRRPETLRLAR